MNGQRSETGTTALTDAVCGCGKALSECACENGGECDCDGECERNGQAQVVTIGQIGSSVEPSAGSGSTSR